MTPITSGKPFDAACISKIQEKTHALCNLTHASTEKLPRLDVHETNIDRAGKISALQHESKFNFDFFKKKRKYLGFHCVELVKTFPLMYQLLM